jgi:hypothetical protein
MRINKLLALFCIGALVMVACSVSVDLGTSPSSTPTQQDTDANQASTMVAQTLQALTQTALFATPASTAIPSATATASGASMPVTLGVSVATNCYAGANTNYGFVTTIRPGVTVTVVGKDMPDNYWVIDVPGYPGTTCWLSGQYASLSGDVSDLPAPAAPPLSSIVYYPYNPGVWCDYSSHSRRWTHWSHGSHHWGGRGWRGGSGGWYCP